jgi:signal recognition particle receptor subunit beta
MVQFNFSERTIKAKVVYYGPAQSGKTTNLEQIHNLSDPEGINRLISLNTAQDRTLFFDLLPFSLGAVAGYDFKVQLYTIPGQVQYNATRRVVLAGADAVVFVADARKSLLKDNQAAFENMKVNLLANRLVPEKVPLVIQYNKQDLPDVLTPQELDRVLNPWGRRTFPAVASEGKGVMETFIAVVQEMLVTIAVKYNLKEKGLDPEGIPSVVAEAFAAVLGSRPRDLADSEPAADEPIEVEPTLEPEALEPLTLEPDALEPEALEPEALPEAPPPVFAEEEPPPPARIVVSQYTESLNSPVETGEGTVPEELLNRSIESNVALAEVLANLVREMNLGLGTIQSRVELVLGYKDEAREKRAAGLAIVQKEATRLRALVAQLGSAASESSAGAGGVSTPPTEGMETLLRDVAAATGSPFLARDVSVDLRVAAGLPTPSVPPLALHRALAAAFEGLAGAADPGSQVLVRCERKPVVLRGRDGAVRRDFLMVGFAHNGTLTAEAQEKIVAGQDAGPLGMASRLFREMGGFLRFAPLPGGAVEARVFLPTT